MPWAMPRLPCPPGQCGEGRSSGPCVVHQPGSAWPSTIIGWVRQVGQQVVQEMVSVWVVV